MKVFVCAVIAACFGLCACAGADPQKEPGHDAQPQPRVYFESSYMNFAWGFKHNGIYVDPQGDVYSYSYRPPRSNETRWSPKQKDSPTERELEEKYSEKYGTGRKLIRRIPPQELKEKQGLAQAASKGKLSEPKHVAADAGRQAALCYVFDPATGRYKEITLRVSGDMFYENMAPEAKALAKWLASLR